MANTYDLAYKTAIVTGAAKGIARAIAEILLANGCDVLIWDANVADLPGVRFVQVDITEPDQVAAAAAAVPADKRVDILVNDAGYLGRTTTFVAHDPADWAANH